MASPIRRQPLPEEPVISPRPVRAWSRHAFRTRGYGTDDPKRAPRHGDMNLRALDMPPPLWLAYDTPRHDGVTADDPKSRYPQRSRRLLPSVFDISGPLTAPTRSHPGCHPPSVVTASWRTARLTARVLECAPRVACRPRRGGSACPIAGPAGVRQPVAPSTRSPIGPPRPYLPPNRSRPNGPSST